FSDCRARSQERPDALYRFRTHEPEKLGPFGAEGFRVGLQGQPEAPSRDDGEEADVLLRQPPLSPNRSLYLVQGQRREPDLLAARPDRRQPGLGPWGDEDDTADGRRLLDRLEG